MTAPTKYKLTEQSPHWASTPLVKMIVHALGVDNVRFVGGAVRDTLLGFPVSDVDMATPYPPTRVIDLLADGPVKTIPTGIDHGTITAVFEGQTCEITTLRLDQETDGRHAVVSFTDDWLEDAKRRDFTINALYMTADGDIFDPFNGLDDIKKKRVRFIGDAKERIIEDALRILRFYRFSAKYALDVDIEGQKACCELVSHIQGLSSERVRDELLKLLTVPSPVMAFSAMVDAGVLPLIFADGFDLSRLHGQFERESSVGEVTSALCRLWLLTHAQYTPKQLTKLLKLSGKEKRFLQYLSNADQTETPNSNADVHRLVYWFGRDVAAEIIKMKAPKPSVVAMLVTLDEWELPIFPVNGNDLMAQGATEGELLGQKLAMLEEAWSASAFSLSKDQLLKMLP
jgi:poly(A) polymerase